MLKEASISSCLSHFNKLFFYPSWPMRIVCRSSSSLSSNYIHPAFSFFSNFSQKCLRVDIRVELFFHCLQEKKTSGGVFTVTHSFLLVSLSGLRENRASIKWRTNHEKICGPPNPSSNDLFLFVCPCSLFCLIPCSSQRTEKTNKLVTKPPK